MICLSIADQEELEKLLPDRSKDYKSSAAFYTNIHTSDGANECLELIKREIAENQFIENHAWTSV
jgi:hypothetical protein